MEMYQITVVDQKSQEYMKSLRFFTKGKDRQKIVQSFVAREYNQTVPAANEADLRKWARKQGLTIKSIRRLV